jgi:hypothetical protein
MQHLFHRHFNNNHNGSARTCSTIKLQVQKLCEMGLSLKKKPPSETATIRSVDSIKNMKSSFSQKSTVISIETWNCFEDI